jgi:predicted dehydrogenase
MTQWLDDPMIQFFRRSCTIPPHSFPGGFTLADSSSADSSSLVRVGVIGLGNMGTIHANYMNSIEGATLAAVSDSNPERLRAVTDKHGCAGFDDPQELIRSKAIDAVLIATPHYQHVPLAIAAFENGLHVLCEKPIAVTIGEARRVNEAAAKHPKLKFAIMFQSRVQPAAAKMRELIESGELGPITRVTWIATNWFRSHAYYASGGWRATWAGEGGGVLINQCPHNLDLLQWITGLMPRRITAIASIAKTHPIEVEDEVSAILEYDNGAVGHFITTTGEAPGTDRLEIAGDRGKLVAERGRGLVFHRTTRSVSEMNRTTPQHFPTVEAWEIPLPLPEAPALGHKLITQNFVRAILIGEPLLAPGTEGAKGLEIGNAMLMSGLTRRSVELPLDAGAYDAFLAELTHRYGGTKKLAQPPGARGAVVDPLPA